MRNWDPDLEHGRLCRPEEHPCKFCGCPVEQAIEGELVCPTCWAGRQLSSEEYQAEQEAERYLNWSRTHCEDCGEYLQGGGVCPECEAEREQIEEALWFDDLYDKFDEVDWGDGEISPDEELRRAALDYKGRP